VSPVPYTHTSPFRIDGSPPVGRYFGERASIAPTPPDPTVPRDALGGAGLRNFLQTVQSEHQQRDDELQDDRVSFIRHCRALDMAFNEIRILLRFRAAPDEKCREVNALLDTHICHVEERIAKLQRLKRQLRELRDKCSSGRSSAQRGVLQGLRATPDGRDMYRLRIRLSDSIASS
jgi:DNA-binding transcriptional MerR regulator